MITNYRKKNKIILSNLFEEMQFIEIKNYIWKEIQVPLCNNFK